MKNKFSLVVLAAIFVLLSFFIGNVNSAKAEIVEVGFPASGIPFNYATGYTNYTAGGGSIIPMVQFMLRGDGATALTKVGVIIRASSTMTAPGEITGIGLYRESGMHAEFQPTEDIAVAGAYRTNPATSTLNVLEPTGGYLVPTSNTEFYIVASTSAASDLVNGDAFDIQLQTNYASTSAGGIVGTAFLSPAKITLEKSANVRISEVKIGATGSNLDEFIELYNRAPFPVDIQTAGISLHTFNATGIATNTPLTFIPGRKIVPKHGYFLITNTYGYSHYSIPADAMYSTSTNLLIVNGGFSIATSSNIANATTSAIDRVGWNNQPDNNCENLITPTNVCAGTAAGATFTVAEDGKSIERIAVGYPDATSTAVSLAAGGADQYKGNGIDRNDNSAEFVLQATANPQNTASPTEFPFGGGQSDNSAPRVEGSWPSNSMTNAPIDMSYVGFNFNEPITGGTINSTSATTSVTLVVRGTLPSDANNLCRTVAYNPSPGQNEPQVKCNLAGTRLTASTVYIFEVGTSTASGIRDLTDNRLDQDSIQSNIQSYQAVFTTGGSAQTTTNITPPSITGSMPFSGSRVPTDITRFFITFSQTMDSSSFTGNIFLYSVAAGVRTAVSWTPTFSYNASTSVLTISNLPTLANNTHYELELDGMDSSGDTTGVKSSNSILLQSPSWVAPFDTTSSDASAPQVLGTMPVQNGAAAVLVSSVAFTIIFDDHIDVSTATSGAATLGIQNGANIASTFTYNSSMKEGYLTAQNLLPAGQTMVLTLLGGSIKNISGTYLGANYTMTFSTESANSDSSGPSIAFANADEFGIAVTYNEAVNSSDATDISKYAVVYTPSGGAQQTLTLSAMAGQSVAYNDSNRTAKISGVYLPPNSSFTVTASNIRDISGNQTASSQSIATVMSSSASGGYIEPGMAGGMTGAPPPSTTFTTATGGTGFAPPANIMTMNNFVSASSTYGFEIPISTQIPLNGLIVITFPTNSDYGLCCVATSSATMQMLNDTNRDINGPGTGTIGIKTIDSNNTAKTVTLTLDTATRSENNDSHDFLRFGLTGIKNPSVAKGPDSSGYPIDIKTKNAAGTTILESNFNVNPVFIGGGNFGGMSTTTIQGRVFSAYDGTTGLNGVNIMLSSQMLGPMPRTNTTATVSGNAGTYSFTDLPTNNDYWIFTEPTVSPTGTTTGYFGVMEPTPIRATSTSIITRNITLTATTSAISLQVSVTASAGTFSATERIDIFAGGPGGFTNQTITPGAGVLNYGATTTLSFQKASSTNGMWYVGMGPAMSKDGMMMGPPPSPNWVMPKPLELNITGCPQNCVLAEAGIPKTTHMFNISSADKRIYGIVKDASGVIISNAMVFAYSTTQMMGGNSQSDSAGKFQINVAQGVYNVGAFYPGMGNSKEASVEVVSGTGESTVYYVDGSKTASTGQSGANPFILTIKRPAYTITGRVSDGTNAISNAPVYAYRTDGPGHSDAMTDTSGNYTLYVDNGSWRVNAYVPGYGQMTEQSVTIAGSNQSNINFSPSSATTYWSVTGVVFESANSTIDSGEGIGGVIVQARSTATGAFYETKTASADSSDTPKGSYTLRVPQLATTTGQYRLEAFKPGYGRIPMLKENLTAIPAFGIVATTTWNIRINARQTVTVNIKNASGNFVTVPEAFIDLFDMNANYGNHAEIRNGTSTTILVPNGASTTIRAFIPSAPPGAISVATDNANNTLVLGDVLEVNGAETIKIVINANLRTISGTIYHTSATLGNELKDAWIEVSSSATGMHYGVAATSTIGAYSVQLADGTYTITAVKSGYMMTPQSLTVSADATQNLIMASANLTISGAITAGGSAAPSAFVWAEKVGGGFTGTQADASGAYSLSVDSGNWRIFAASDKYSKAGYSGNPLNVGASQTGINIALTSSASIRNEIVTSNTFKDSATGSFEDTTLNVKVNADSNTICLSSGCSGSDSYITANETVNYPDMPTVNVISDKAKDISAYSGGSTVTTLASGKKATVELTYTKTELATEGIDTPTEVSQLKIGTINEQNNWETLSTVATYKDSSGNAVAVATTSTSIPASVTQITFITTEASHFSPFALTAANDPDAPSKPAGLSATAASPGTASIALTWSASTGSPTGYYVYRNTSSGATPPLLADAGNVTSYTDSSVSLNTTYYYRIGAYKTSGGNTLESQASDEASAATLSSSGGGTVSGGGGGSAPTIPSQTAAVVPATPAVPAVPTVSPAVPAVPSSAAQPSVVALTVSPAFNRTLKIGMSHPDVKRLQQILNSDSDTKVAESGVGSLGKETNYFGPATKKALQKFQAKYGIVSSGDETTTGYGLLGPATRAKLAEAFSEGVSVPTAKAAAKPSAVAPAVSPIFTQGLSRGISGSDVKRLQQILNSDSDTKVAESGVGSLGNETNYFGPATERAVQKFQMKHGIVQSASDSGYGYLGPKTRAKIQEIFEKAEAPATGVQQPTETVKPATAAASEIQKQINTLLEQIKALQEQMNKL